LPRTKISVARSIDPHLVSSLGLYGGLTDVGRFVGGVAGAKT
jgi:hypothetical protein